MTKEGQRRLALLSAPVRSGVHSRCAVPSALVVSGWAESSPSPSPGLVARVRESLASGGARISDDSGHWDLDADGTATGSRLDERRARARRWASGRTMCKSEESLFSCDDVLRARKVGGGWVCEVSVQASTPSDAGVQHGGPTRRPARADGASERGRARGARVRFFDLDALTDEGGHRPRARCRGRIRIRERDRAHPPCQFQSHSPTTKETQRQPI